MYKKCYRNIAVLKRSGNLQLDTLRFLNEDTISIKLYSFSIVQQMQGATKKRGYIIELHEFNGFAFLKFYPRTLKNHAKKYELRSEDIGFQLSFAEVRNILWQCAHLMKTYLEENPDNFVGYVGQTDKKDNVNNRLREKSQRSSIYDMYVSSLFKLPKYSLSAEELFASINLKLIRNVNGFEKDQLTRLQKENYINFLNFIDKNKSTLPLLMTERTRKSYFKSHNFGE